MYELTVETDFSAAHRLREYEGLCENLHGHNWQVVVTVASAELNELGMVIDFRDIKQAVGTVIDHLDHKYLNDLPPFDEINPTTENLARYFCEKVDPQLSDDVCVVRVQVWESSRCSATYTPLPAPHLNGGTS